MKHPFFRHRRPAGIFFVLSLLFGSFPLFPQTRTDRLPVTDTMHVEPGRLSALMGGVLATGLAIHYERYVPLRKEYASPFRFRENHTYALDQDKLLHFYGAFVGSALSAKGFQWSGMKDEDALLYGSATSLALFTMMKVEDGQISYLGFDRIDEAANILGAAYPVARYYVPWLKSFTPKGSYISSGINGVAQGQRMPGFLEDHEGQKFWMGVTVHDLLPEGIQEYWPSPLGIAFGWTLRGIETPQPYHELIIALDVDLRKLPGESPFLRTLWEVLNDIHLPMPAVRVSPSAVWYGLYF